MKVIASKWTLHLTWGNGAYQIKSDTGQEDNLWPTGPAIEASSTTAKWLRFNASQYRIRSVITINTPQNWRFW